MGWRSIRRQYERERDRDRRRENELRSIMNSDEKRYHDEMMASELYEITMRQQRRGIEAKVRREVRIEIFRFVLYVASMAYITWALASNVKPWGIPQPPTWPGMIVGAIIIEGVYNSLRARRT